MLNSLRYPIKQTHNVLLKRDSGELRGATAKVSFAELVEKLCPPG